jgi:dipeptidyl aminopeptidase/acylaminoacyl peptidase
MRSWRWVDDDDLLITLSSRQNYMGEWFDATRVIAYNRTTRKVTRLGWAGSKFAAGRILWVSHEGPPTILLERSPDNGDTEKLGVPEVIKVDVVTGATQIVQRQSPSIRRWYADGAGIIRLGTGHDRDTGKSVAIYRSSADSNFRTVYSGKEDRFDPLPLPDIFLQAADKGITTSRKDGYAAVYELDLNTFQLGRKLFAVPGYDVDGVASGPSRDSLDTVLTTERRSRRVYFAPRLKEIQSGLDETFGDGNAKIVSADLKRERLIVEVAKPGMPGGFYLYDTSTGGVGLLGWVNGAIKDRVLNPVTSVRYRASDGKEIEAVLTMPRHRLGQKNLPLIVLPHGGPWARDSED